jgi:polyribonucleotide nucleotidyltransferase
MVVTEVEASIAAAYQIAEKLVRQDTLSDIRAAVVEKLTADEQFEESDIRDIIEEIEKRVVRTAILSDRKRIDGRELDVVRPIAVRTGVLSRTHGSALFTRGETQALVVATLGTERDSQIMTGKG